MTFIDSSFIRTSWSDIIMYSSFCFEILRTFDHAHEKEGPVLPHFFIQKNPGFFGMCSSVLTLHIPKNLGLFWTKNEGVLALLVSRVWSNTRSILKQREYSSMVTYLMNQCNKFTDRWAICKIFLALKHSLNRNLLSPKFSELADL